MHVVHISSNLERPVPKSVAILLGKLEDYLKRSPHRAPKVFRRLRRHCDAAVLSVVGSSTHVGVVEIVDESIGDDETEDEEKEHNVNLARVRVSLEAFDLLLMIDELRADDVIVGAELLPLLAGLMSKGIESSSPSPSAAAAAAASRKRENARILRCFGCFYMYHFISSLDDLTFAENIDAVVGIVHDIVRNEIRENASSGGVLPADNRCCQYAVRVLHEIVRYCRRTGHIVKKMSVLALTLLMWIEASANSTSTMTAAVDASSHTKILMSPLPVSTLGTEDETSVEGAGTSGSTASPTIRGAHTVNGDGVDDQDGGRRSSDGASASSSPSLYCDAESELIENEAIQALRELAVLGSDLDTAKLTVAPILSWLSGVLDTDDEEYATSGEPKCRWTEPVGAIVSSAVLTSYVEEDQAYVLLQLVLQHAVGSHHLSSPTQHGYDCLASEVCFVKRSLGSLEKELAVPALLLLFKELLPILDTDDTNGAIGAAPSGSDGAASFQASLLELLTSASVKLGDCRSLLHVIAAVLSGAVYRNMKQLASSTRVDENSEIAKAARCLRKIACAAVERLGSGGASAASNGNGVSKGTSITNDDDDDDDDDDVDDGANARGVLSSDFPLALSNEICRAFLTSTTISTATAQQVAQQVAVLDLFSSCLSLTTDGDGADRSGSGGTQYRSSFVPSILTPSKSSSDTSSHAPQNVISRHQLLTLLSSIFLRLMTSSMSPEFIVAADACFKRLLSTNCANVVLPVALPMALAVQELALYGRNATGGLPASPSGSDGDSASSMLNRLRLLMLSFSMLRHIGKHYACAELPKEAHPRSVQGIVDGEDGICLDTKTAAAAGGSSDDAERVLSLFVNEFDNKGGVGSARDSVVNAILSKYAISSSISKTSKQELALAFCPLQESLLLQQTSAAATTMPAPRAPSASLTAPAPAQPATRTSERTRRGHGSQSNKLHVSGSSADAAGTAAANGASARVDRLPSVRDVLDRILGKPRTALSSASTKNSPSNMGRDDDVSDDDDVKRDEAIKALNGSLDVMEDDIDEVPIAENAFGLAESSYKSLATASPEFIDSAVC